MRAIRPDRHLTEARFPKWHRNPTAGGLETPRTHAMDRRNTPEWAFATSEITVRWTPRHGVCEILCHR